MDRTTIPEALHQPAEELHGFRVDTVTRLSDIKALCYEVTHVRTGARLMHLHCNDEENMFCVGFCTPPTDSTGVAHILEHSVLAGSRKYPVKDAFNELGKRTMNTFLNAMTWPDRTIYPTCSAVRQDYFNLAAVYMDLVFNPLLKEETFKQEGHHLTFESEGETSSALKVSGVVYNEMKGVYSAPEAIAERDTLHALFPDTTYGVDSGGDPDVIPELTYQQFCDFHRQYYSPGNARFLLYGNISLADNLEFVDGYLQPFESTDLEAQIALQPVWDAPRVRQLSYPIGTGDALEKKTFVTVNWMVNQTADVQASLLMDVLVDALSGSAAGPLRRALIDSGLGQDIFPRGAYETDLRQGMVSFGLRETDPQHAEAIERLILETLGRVADEGLDPALVDASLHSIEFQGKEIVPPFPVMLMMRANGLWYYGADPKDGLRFSSLVARVREDIAADPSVFQRMIRRWFLDNPHRLRVELVPSDTLAAEQKHSFEQRMAEKKRQLSEQQLQRIADQAEALKRSQTEPDAPEALQTLPWLALEDIPRAVRRITTETGDHSGVRIMQHPTFSNGVVYLGLSFDLSGLDEELMPYLPLLGKATLGMGAAGLDYQQMAVRIAQNTGGLSYSTTAGRTLRGGEHYSRFSVDGKALARKTDQLLAIVQDILLSPETSDHKRLKELVLESASRASSRIVPSGHRYAYVRAASRLDKQFYRREQWGGITQIRFLKQQALSVDNQVGGLAGRLAALQRQLFVRDRLVVSLAGDAEALRGLRLGLEKLIDALPAASDVAAADSEWSSGGPNSGVVIPAQVNYVGQVVQLPGLLDNRAADFEMLATVLSNDFCYKRIRVQGGAYGGFCFYSAADGILALLSYRDPNLEQTYQVFNEVVDYARQGLDEAAVNSSRIGAIGSISRMVSPGQTLRVARSRYFAEITDQDRQRFRDGLFSSDAERIKREALPELARALPLGPRAVLASRERLEAFNETQDQPFELVTLE